MKRLLKKIKNNLIYLSVVFLLAIFKILPNVAIKCILKNIAKILCYLPLRENDIAIRNLSMFYDKKTSKKILKDLYIHWAVSIFEIIAVCLKKEDIKKYAFITEDSKRCLDEALKKQKGVVFCTAHLGNWEIMAINLAREGYDVNTIAKESYDPRFTKLIKETRESNGVKCIFRNEKGIFSKINDVLARNAIMGFLIDQNTKVSSVSVKFMGIEALTPVAPIRILKDSGASLVVGYNHRVNNKIQTEIKCIEYSKDETEEEILLRINNVLSDEILKFPHEWIWIHNRWNIF